MSVSAAEDLFTPEQPLGPIAISDDTQLNTLQALYDSRVNLHVQSEHNPPTFIVGRRGSGKTSLLLSREFDPGNVAIRLSTADLFGHLQAAVERLEPQALLTVEVIAGLWDAILWAPIAVRLATEPSVQSEGAAFQTVWEETVRMRALKPTRMRTGDDVVIGHLAEQLIDFIEQNPQCRTVDAVTSAFRAETEPWSSTIDACQQLLETSRLPVFVLIDSLEDVGPLIERLRPTLRGLFHLVGQTRLAQAYGSYRIQCCFPSELWPLLDDMSSNPVKDLSGRLVLQWRWHDLLSACDSRLRMYLNLHHRELLDSGSAGEGATDLIHTFLPPTVTSRIGRTEETIPYILRHTQLLPRQLLYILNECFARAIAERSQPYPSSTNVVDAVGEVEATLCPEVFSAHSFRYKHAEQIAARMVPRLPFRFSEGSLHKAYNQSGLKSHGLDYDEVRQLLTDVGVVGRFLDETERYYRAEFAYSFEGQLIPSPDDELCLHPMFVRQFSSADLLPGRPAPKPVYPVGTPESTQ